MILADSAGAPLAASARGLRITFGAQDNGGTGYVEIEALNATPVPDPVWTKAPYSQGTFSPAANNLLANATPLAYSGLPNGLEGTAGVGVLTDGVVPTAADMAQYGKLCGVPSNASVTYSLGALPVTLNEVRIYSMWKDSGRDQIGIASIQYQDASGDTWHALPESNVTYDQGTFLNSAFFARPDGSPLAENATAIRINFSTQENGWCGYAEIEALGFAAEGMTVPVTGLSLSAWRAALSWTPMFLGAGASSADIYFDYGLDASSLSPALVISNLLLDAEGSYSIPDTLTASTVYSYAYYVVNDLGTQSETFAGTFTTPAAIPVEAAVMLKYAGTNKAAFEGVVTNLGEEGSSAAFYFALGTDASALVPVAVTNGLAAGETFEIPFTGLETATTYAYAFYAVNDLGNRSVTYTGTIATSDGSAPRWIGLVSENWSDGLNWDTEVAPAANSTVARIILDYPYGCYPPANLDITGLSITRLRIASTRDYSYTMDGEPFTCWGVDGEGSASAEVTILNDIELRDGGWGNFTVGLQSHQKLHLDGTLSSPVEGLTVRNAEPGGSLYLGGENTFSGRVECHIGTFYFTSDAALGVAPADLPETPNLQENWGSLRAFNDGSIGLNVIDLVPTRYQLGEMYLQGSVELVHRGLLGDNCVFHGSSGAEPEHLILSGTTSSTTSTPLSGPDAISFDNNLLGILDSNDIASESTRRLYTTGATLDLNGHTVAPMLSNYSFGFDAGPNFINNNRDSETVVTGQTWLYPNIGVPIVFYGGAGDIRTEGDIVQGTASGRNPNNFRKIGQGRLTIAGENNAWSSSTLFSGDTTLDYRTYNTRKLGATDVTMAYGDLHIDGNASAATVCELAKVTLNGGLVTLSAEGGAGLSLSLSNISGFARDRAIDFQFDANTTLAFTDTSFANNAKFGAMNAGATWDHGSAFAYLNGDGTAGPLPAALLDTTLGENTIWRIGAGTTTVTSGWHHPVGLFLDGAGDTTVVVEGGIDIESDGGACPILVSSACGGDVFFTNGTIKSQNYNRGIVIHNWNTNGVLRISSNLPETNDNNFMICGPGTTILDNDSNNYYYGPHTFGGGTVRFTSMADRQQRSALGRGNNDNGHINIGHGCTFEYIGTAPEGHSSNRRLNLYGDVTLKASGVGPLTLTGETAIAGGFATSRLILDGAGEGAITGAVAPGSFGSVVKRGAGTWTIASDSSSYEYPTEVEEGTLVLDGSLPSSVEVGGNGTLALGSGAVIKRHLSSDGTLRFNVGDDPESYEPATVWGRAEINGAVALSKRPRAATEIPLLSAENGLTGTFAPESPHVKLVVRDGTLYAKSANAATILLIQ